MKQQQNVYLCRHGETIWSISGQHTGTTDLPLTEKGLFESRCLAKKLKPINFSHVFCSSLLRAQQTAQKCGLLDKAIIDKDLMEWNYGDFEGLTTIEIHKIVPNWNIFTHGAKNGESVDQIRKRTEKFIRKISLLEGNICLFSSGHISRSLIASWIGLDVSYGKNFELSTASLSLLSYEREMPTIKLLNDISHYQMPHG